jgi:hypothetical protein
MFFAAWTPPVNIPARWQGGDANYAPPLPSMTDVSVAVKFEDKACIVTGATTALQASHLVPKSEANWVRSENAVVVPNLIRHES